MQGTEGDGMRRETTLEGSGTRLVLVDSITEIGPDDAGAVVISGSHGGISAGRYAAEVALAAVFFNDAGVGKEMAGIASLTALDEKGIPGGTVGHNSARIGEAEDTWATGVISHLNPAARVLGFATGAPLRRAVQELL